jgi:hypothetical protein
MKPICPKTFFDKEFDRLKANIIKQSLNVGLGRLTLKMEVFVNQKSVLLGEPEIDKWPKKR